MAAVNSSCGVPPTIGGIALGLADGMVFFQNHCSCTLVMRWWSTPMAYGACLVATELGVNLQLVGVLTPERRKFMTMVLPHLFASGVNLLARKAEGDRFCGDAATALTPLECL